MSDRSEVFHVATCSHKIEAGRCLSAWSKICRVCNLAFCGIHVDHHACKPDDRAARQALYPSDPIEIQDPVEESCFPPPL